MLIFQGVIFDGTPRLWLKTGAKYIHLSRVSTRGNPKVGAANKDKRVDKRVLVLVQWKWPHDDISSMTHIAFWKQALPWLTLWGSTGRWPQLALIRKYRNVRWLQLQSPSFGHWGVSLPQKLTWLAPWLWAKKRRCNMLNILKLEQFHRNLILNWNDIRRQQQ